jgi:hypothetical protein
VDLARTQRIMPHIEHTLNLVTQSVEQTGSRGPNEYLEQTDDVLRALEGVLRAAGTRGASR